MNIFKRARVRHILRRHAIPHELWLKTSGMLIILQGLSPVEKARLRELATLFLYEKKFAGAHGLRLSDAMCIIIAVQACLPVLQLGLEYLSGWSEIIVYPGPFLVDREEMDADGVVHGRKDVLTGESWSRGPLIVSWDDVEMEMQEAHSGSNVVIHEIAHKLDMLNGPADGFPPLHQGMPVADWSASLGAAYEYLVRRVEHRRRAFIDPYGSTSPAEFFAVTSEYFFCAPEILHMHFPGVYRQLQIYYRQSPLQRFQSFSK